MRLAKSTEQLVRSDDVIKLECGDRSRPRGFDARARCAAVHAFKDRGRDAAERREAPKPAPVVERVVSEPSKHPAAAQFTEARTNA
jgi:hypothetical protein